MLNYKTKKCKSNHFTRSEHFFLDFKAHLNKFFPFDEVNGPNFFYLNKSKNCEWKSPRFNRMRSMESVCVGEFFQLYLMVCAGFLLIFVHFPLVFFFSIISNVSNACRFMKKFFSEKQKLQNRILSAI